MADRRRKNVAVVFEVVGFAREAAERSRNIRGDRRFLGNDQFLVHGKRKAAEDTRKGRGGSTHPAFYLRARARVGLARQLGRRACGVLKRSSATSRLVGVCWFQSTISTISFSWSRVSASPEAAS